MRMYELIDFVSLGIVRVAWSCFILNYFMFYRSSCSTSRNAAVLSLPSSPATTLLEVCSDDELESSEVDL